MKRLIREENLTRPSSQNRTLELRFYQISLEQTSVSAGECSVWRRRPLSGRTDG